MPSFRFVAGFEQAAVFLIESLIHVLFESYRLLRHHLFVEKSRLRIKLCPLGEMLKLYLHLLIRGLLFISTSDLYFSDRDCCQ